MPATSLPPPGSVMARAAIFSPRSTGGMKRCFCSSVPKLTMGGKRDAMAPEAHGDTDGATGDHQLFGGGEDMGDVTALTAVLFGVTDAAEAALAGLLVELARELVGLFPGVGVRGDLGAREASDLLAELGVLGRLVKRGREGLVIVA
jgi:hypothetical protein